ncbi:hypothetical protein GCM10027159_12280 [Lysobacter terrae]
MSPIRRIALMVVPTSTRLAWSRSAIQRGYGKKIAAARFAKNLSEVALLEDTERWELQLQGELEDDHLTSSLLRRARRLRVPIPYVHNSDGAESDHWYQGNQTGGWYLTTLGVNSLRREIRQEQKARHENLALLLPWLTAITGIIGTVTGLVAVLASG